MANNNITCKKLEKLIQEWLATIDNGKEYWDGVYCSDREMASSFVIEGRSPSNIMPLLDFIKEKLQNS